MIHVECPWCDGPAVVDAGTVPGEGQVRCEGCGVAVELAPELATEPIARAA
jgi:hypothetical protein